MKWNKNLIIYLYDASEDTQNAALSTLAGLQYYEVKEFDITSQQPAQEAINLLKRMPPSSGDQKKIRHELIYKLEHTPQDIETPIMVTSEKIMLLKDDGKTTFKNYIERLNTED